MNIRPMSAAEVEKVFWIIRESAAEYEARGWHQEALAVAHIGTLIESTILSTPAPPESLN
jgi:hypothetical protein